MDSATFGTATVTHENRGRIHIFTFSGEIDETNVNQVFQSVERYIKTDRRIVFDVGGLNYGNSKFIGFMSSLFSQMEDEGGAMHICNATGSILDTLELCGLSFLLSVTGTVEDAIREMETTPAV